MCREDGINADATKEGERVIGAEACLAHASQRAAKISPLNAACRILLIQLMREPSALAVVGLCQIDQLEVKSKRPCKLVRSGKVEAPHSQKRLPQMSGGGACIGCTSKCSLCFASCDRTAAQSLDGFIQRIPGLLAENFAQQHSQRPHIAAQRSFLQLAGRSLKFG
jgi:hypothetical protein